MTTDPTRPIGTFRLGFLLSSASGPVDSHPLKAKIENTTPRNRFDASPQLAGLSGAKLKPPGPGSPKDQRASRTMIAISIVPVMISSFSESEMPAYAHHDTSTSPRTGQIHHAIVTS